jgi:hypothetical protein
MPYKGLNFNEHFSNILSKALFLSISKLRAHVRHILCYDTNYEFR